jgi:hypothetical protein
VRNHRESYRRTVIAGFVAAAVAFVLAGLLVGLASRVAPVLSTLPFWSLLRWLGIGALVALGLAAMFVALGGAFALQADAQEGHHPSGLGAVEHPEAR